MGMGGQIGAQPGQGGYDPASIAATGLPQAIGYFSPLLAAMARGQTSGFTPQSPFVAPGVGSTGSPQAASNLALFGNAASGGNLGIFGQAPAAFDPTQISTAGVPQITPQAAPMAQLPAPTPALAPAPTAAPQAEASAPVDDPYRVGN